MLAPQDALELLLPEADDAARERMRRVTSFLRLFVDDAHAAQAQSVEVDLPRARRELEMQSRGQVETTLRDLLRHHLEAAAPADSFLWLTEPASEVQSAWSSLEELRSTHDGLPGVPRPGESALSVAARLVAGLEAVGGTPHECSLWRARIESFARGPRAGEVGFRRAIDAAIAIGSVPRLRSALAGAAECLLDRGAVREARQLLLDHLARAGATSRLRQLLAWARLCLDDAAGARSVLVGLKPWSGPIPASLVELRERRREWLPMLTGRGRTAPVGGAPACETASELDRAAIGASVLAVFVFRRGAGAACLTSDAAPALRERIGPWLGECEGSASLPGTLQHQLLVEARAVCRSVDANAASLGMLGGETTATVFLEPLLDDEGEVVGWLHGELEHHLAPSATRREALARCWRARVLRELARGPSLAVRTEQEGRAEEGEGPCARHFEALVERLGIKTAQRLWWGFAVREGEPELVASGGFGHGFPEAAPGRKRALERALGAGGPVAFDEADERLSVHGGSSSGIALLLRVAGRACAVLAIESSRRRDFRTNDLQRLQALVDGEALTHRAAQFRQWHALRFGHDVWFETERADVDEFVRRLVVAARGVNVLAITGPDGAGKQVLSRWAHFESPRARGALEHLGPGRLQSVGALRAAFERLRGGTLVVEAPDKLAPEVQEALLERVEGFDPTASHADGPPALHFHGSRPLAELAETGGLRRDLARCLDRVQLRVPALCDRREDVLPLVDCFTRRFAAEHGVRPPTFTDEACGLLWRQPWPGNVRELENLVYKLVLFSRDARLGSQPELGPIEVARIARENHVHLARRLASRHPRRSDLIAALRTTRLRGGRVNKSRAALYLGWDPDTLAARLDDAKIRAEELILSEWGAEGGVGAEEHQEDKTERSGDVTT